MHRLALLLAFQQALWIDVPFVQQDKNGCGAASIWMVMMYWRPDATPAVAEIQQQLYSEKAGGIYAKDMARYFESYGYRSFAFKAEWADLEEHVAKGRPVIVCLERNRRGVPLHYVVVAGIDSASNLVLVNDPAQRKLLSMSRSDFEQSWRATDNWALLAVPELELASRAFRDENLDEAREHLDAALRLNPSDAYTNEFLATIYFLKNNTEAALKYWNRSGKPRIENIRIDPPLRTDPILLDRAFAFSRGSNLRLSDFETTQARLSALGIFSRARMDLSPVGDNFDLTLRAAERTGTNIWSWLRGVPFETVYPEIYDVGRKGINAQSMLRWDSNKRRASVSFESPIAGNPARKFRTTFDGRSENWASVDGNFQMRKAVASAEIHAVPSGRWSWTSGAEISQRTFTNNFLNGVQLKYSGSVKRTLLRDPEKYLDVSSSLNFEAGKLWATSPTRFVKLASSTTVRWRDFASQMQWGSTIGESPFDERYTLGLDRDSDLWLRAHSAIITGRKSASSITRGFVLTNSDYQRSMLRAGWFHVSSGPFLDTAKSSISSGWLVDTGVEVRLSILGSVGLRLSYGKSVSDGRQSVFLRPSTLE